jgi:hypothetical protein
MNSAGVSDRIFGWAIRIYAANSLPLRDRGWGVNRCRKYAELHLSRFECYL